MSLLVRKWYFYLQLLMWITPLKAEPGKRQNMLSSEVKARWLPWLLNPCLPIPIDRDQRGYYHPCLPPTPQPTYIKCLFLPLWLLFWYGRRWRASVWMTQNDQRHRPGPGVWPAELSKRQGLTPQPPNWAIDMVFQGGSWLETSCFFRKQCRQTNLWKKNVTWQITFKGC